jgi:hypothetical protein
VPALQLSTAVSRKTHGSAGDFDVALPLSGSPGIECRGGGATNDYQIVFTFSNNVESGTASIDSGVGTISGLPVFAGNTMTVNLTGVDNVQVLTVRLSGVTDQYFQTLPDALVSMGVLIGDTNGNASVNAADVAQTKSELGQPVSSTNFRTDVNANGVINSADDALVKSHAGESLPPAGPKSTSPKTTFRF